MALNLHPSCRARLQEGLLNALQQIVASNGMFLDRSSMGSLDALEAVLPQAGKLHDQLVEYVDDWPFSEFISDMLAQELWEMNKYIFESSPKLMEIPGYEDPAAVSERLLNQFESLPWQYQITIPLPRAIDELLAPEDNVVDLGRGIRLVRAGEEFAADFPLASPNKRREQRLAGTEHSLLTIDNPPTWDAGRLYVQAAAEGFIGQYGNTGAAANAERLVRAVFGMGLAHRLFDHKPAYNPTPERSTVFVHCRGDDGKWEPITRYPLDDRAWRVLSSLVMHDLEGTLKPEQRRGFCLYNLNNIGAALKSGKVAEPTLLAAQWFFDSFGEVDPLLPFIQCTVVLEIILGDKSAADEIGISELISNRFAYLIGTTHDERADLIASFKKLYKVRSQIVHSGKHRLTVQERLLFQHLRWMCRRAICKEVEFLKAGLKAAEPTADAKIG